MARSSAFSCEGIRDIVRGEKRPLASQANLLTHYTASLQSLSFPEMLVLEVIVQRWAKRPSE